MGKLATVVYDAVEHKAVVTRTRVATPAERYGVIDAVGAFAHHCEMLRGVAHSPVQVSAMWGGPPYITYQVVRSRFRAIVMWTDAPGDYDLAFDVQDALIRLHAAITEVSDGLLAGDAAAQGYAYHVAGLVLHDAHVQEIIPGENTPAFRRPAAIADAAKKAVPAAATSSESKKSGLIRNLFSSKSRKSDAARSRTSSKSSSSESHILPGLSAPQTMSLDADLPVEEVSSESHVDLPDDVFAFVSGTESLPQSDGDLNWIANLVQGIDKQKVQPLPPIVRDAQPATGEVSGVEASETVGETPDAAVAHDHDLAEELSETMAGSSIADPGTAEPSMPTNVHDSGYAELHETSSARRQVGQELNARSSAKNLHQESVSDFATNRTEQYSPRSTMSATNTAESLSQANPVLFPAAHEHIQQFATSSPQDDFDVAALGGLRDNATVSSTATETESDSSSTLSSRTSDSVRARMNEFANSMQAGNFPLAFQQVSSTLRHLSSLQSVARREIITCASYYQALKILIRVRALEEELARFPPASPDAMRRTIELALLTMFLAERKDLLPRHSAAAKKIAIEKNMVAGNFGMSARWLRSLIETAPVNQKQAFTQKLQLCVQNGELNTHMPSSKWLCFGSLTVVSSGGVKCNLCPAVFASVGTNVSAQQQCPVCHVGMLAVLTG